MTKSKDGSSDICACCRRLLSKHDHIQDRICLQQISDTVWSMRKTLSDPEITKLLNHYRSNENK